MELAREAANKAMQEKQEENHQIATQMKEITKEKLIEKEDIKKLENEVNSKNMQLLEGNNLINNLINEN